MKKIFENIKNRRTPIWERVHSQFYSVSEGGKKVFNLNKSFTIFALTIASVMFVGGVFDNSDDTSTLAVSYEPLSSVENHETPPVQNDGKDSIKGLSTKRTTYAESEASPRGRISMAPSNIEYRAQQVIVRKDLSTADNTLPMGTNMIGKLMTHIDSRNPSKLIKILLPYGGSYKGNRLIPKDTVLFSESSYSGRGSRVFLQVHTGLLPSGREFKIEAQVLESKDFSPGIDGEFHGTFSKRLAANTLLSLGEMTEILQDKEAMGQGFEVTKKATAKNALLGGAERFMESEAQRQADEFENEQPYVTVSAEKEMIISLTSAFVNADAN